MRTKASPLAWALRRLICAVLTIGIAAGHAQEAGMRAPVRGDAHDQIAGEVKTGKERLGEKASDGPRLDNCKVPLDRRGPTIRPEGCKPSR